MPGSGRAAEGGEGSSRQRGAEAVSNCRGSSGGGVGGIHPTTCVFHLRACLQGFTNAKWVEGELLVFGGDSPFVRGAQLGFTFDVRANQRWVGGRQRVIAVLRWTAVPIRQCESM